MPKPITETAVTETAVATENLVPIKKPAAKKPAAKKPAAKAPANKPVAKAAGVPAEPRAKKGLRKAQVRIIKFLAKAGRAQPRTVIAEKAQCDLAGLTGDLGPLDPEKRKYNDEKYFPSLITLGLIKAKEQDVNGKSVVFYEITANGKKVAAKAE